MSRLKYDAVFNWTPDYAEIPSALWDALRVFNLLDLKVHVVIMPMRL